MKSKFLFLLLISGLLSAQNTPDFSLIGFGEATTGGDGGEVVTATTYSQLKSYAESSAKYVIKVSGTIENGADGGSIKVRSNKTIIGEGNSAFLFGVGLTIGGYNNIIIRNIKFSMTGVTTRTDKSEVYSSTGDEGRPQILTNGGDCIGIQNTSYNIWIDHCEFFSEDPSVQTNQDLYDGLVDVKNTSHNITISWNYFHHHHKTHLIGSSESDYSDRKITFHHNYYYKCKDRIPLYRGGTGHFLNNYLLDCPNGVNTRINACVYVEKNHFENVTSGTIYSKSSTIVGYASDVDNLFTNSKSPTAGLCNSFVPSAIYDYAKVVTDKTEVKNVVTTWAGTGKLDVTAITPVYADVYNVRKLQDKILIDADDAPELTLHNVSGQVISTIKSDEISLSGLKNGVYILIIKSESKQVQRYKFVL